MKALDFIELILPYAQANELNFKKQIHSQIRDLKIRPKSYETVLNFSELKTGLDWNVGLEDLIKSFGKGNGDVERAIAFYYLFNIREPYFEAAQHLDDVLFEHEKNLSHKFPKVDFSDLPRFKAQLNKELAPMTPSGWTSQRNWTIENERLRQFFCTAVPGNRVQDLIEITHVVINENMDLAPKDVQNSIVQRAIDEGIVNGDTGIAWLRAGLTCAIQPSSIASFTGEGSEDFARLYEQNWKFDPDWIREVAALSEDISFLNNLDDKIDVSEKGGPQKLKLVKCLSAIQSSQPVIADGESVIGHLSQMIQMNRSEDTQAFLMYAKARNQAVTGQSEQAIATYLDLKDYPFTEERRIEVRYHLLNASYALRDLGLFGSSDVSRKLSFGAANKDNANSLALAANLDGFDATQEIDAFRTDFNIDVKRTDVHSVLDYVRAFGGPAGAKIIYFHHLECMLQNGHDHKALDFHYEEIVRLLKSLSETARYGNVGQLHTTEAWYPFILLHSVSGNFQHYGLMKRIEETLTTFDGWKYQKNLASSVQDEKSNGSFLMLLFELNRLYGETRQGHEADFKETLLSFSNNFKHFRAMPALGQTINHGMRQLGLHYEPLNDVPANANQAISHWNYLIGGGVIHPS